jgi:hypothetical protein
MPYRLYFIDKLIVKFFLNYVHISKTVPYGVDVNMNEKKTWIARRYVHWW